ncbi:MAG: hypothetical protein HEP71_20115 [Roseivirga sp.]|nr:hypothetical protein [Roseivirga sp.]
MKWLISLILCASLLGSCQQGIQYTDPLETKIGGLTFTGPGRGPLHDQMFSSMAEVGGNFVALVPEATVYRQNLRVVYDFEGQWFGERKQATLEGISLARKNGLKVMLKPHLTIGWDLSRWKAPSVDFEDSVSRMQFIQSQRTFISSQENRIEGNDYWRGALMTKNDADWDTFARGYENYILDYARIADSLKVELFCIGTEMKRTALEKPEFWHNLIRKVRTVYSGPLVYAANWDSYDKIGFWNELDYIGVDAYFPLSKKQHPDFVDLKSAWDKYRIKLERLAAKHHKPIILTEWGYQNEDYVGAEPWDNNRYNNTDNTVNNMAQKEAYQSMFESIWQEPWMKGVFVWRWSEYKGVLNNPNYSPRGKPAAEILKRWFEGN